MSEMVDHIDLIFPGCPKSRVRCSHIMRNTSVHIHDCHDPVLPQNSLIDQCIISQRIFTAHLDRYDQMTDFEEIIHL